MKNIKPSLAIKQPLLWRQAISKSKFGILNWKNFYLYPLTKWFFIFKKHECIKFDYTIIGSNPILTHLLLIQLYEKAFTTKQKINVSIYITPEKDYWSYHLFENEHTWKYINESLKINMGDNFLNFLNRRIDIFQNPKLFNVTLIDNSNISIAYYHKDTKYTNGYTFHLKDYEILDDDFEKAMPNVLLSENNIKDKYIKQYNEFLSSNNNPYVSYLKFSNNKKTTIDSDIPTHILLTQHIFINTLSNWLNTSTVEKKETDYNKNIYSSTQFHHFLQNYSFGTAKHIANDFVSLEHQTIEDFISLVKNKID